MSDNTVHFRSDHLKVNALLSMSMPVPDEPVEVVEVDEMHTFVGQKKVTVGFGLR